MNVSRITVARLYNLGSYEHIKYEISVDVPKTDSASDAMLALEHIMEALKPESKCGVHSWGELERESFRLVEMEKLLEEQGPEEFTRRHGHFVGTPEEFIARCEKSYTENMEKRLAYEARAKKARELLDNLGGAVEWKDAKLDWEDEQ